MILYPLSTPSEITTRFRNIGALIKNRSQQSAPKTIPLEAQAFYKDFGFLTHPATRRPAPYLTPYQREIWNDQSKYRLVIKSQKVGITTSALLEDFQRSITVAKGKDILVIAQSQRHANEHIRTLKYMVVNSEKYARYLITSIGEFGQFKEEKSKVHVAYIVNDDAVNQPTRVIGLGAAEGGVWSWKNVAHIHISDIAAASIKDDSGLFAAAFSRLANTSGTMLIESPPRGPRGQLYDIYTKSKFSSQAGEEEGGTPEGQFKVWEIPAREAVASGLISQQFLDAEKSRLGSLYRQYYEAAFISAIYAAFDVFALEQAEADGLKIGVTPLNQYAPRSMGIDPGFGSSEFALTIIESVPHLGNKNRVLYAQSFERATYEQMKSAAYQLIKRHDIDTVYVDAANPEFIRSLKIMLEDEPTTKYEDVVRAANSKGHRLEDIMKVVPVNFRQEDKALLQHAKALIEAGEIAIHPDFNDLLNDLRIAQEINGGLDKRQGNRLDLVDSFRLACKFLRPIG